LKLNLANILTLFRIAAIPIVVVCFYSQMPNARPIAAILFGIAAITDLIDGWVARRYGQTSRFGEFLDPVADKLMVSIVLVMLVQAEASWFEDVIAMIIIGREITISALREWMAQLGKRASVAVSGIAKVKTGVQMTAIPILIWYPSWPAIEEIRLLGLFLLALAVILTLWSMVLYFRAFLTTLEEEAESADS